MTTFPLPFPTKLFHKNLIFSCSLALALFATSISPSPSLAQSFTLELTEKLNQHPSVQAAQKEVEAAEQNLNSADDAYYPTLFLNASYGLEHLERKNKNQTDPIISDLTPYDLRLGLRQNIFRGGTDEANFNLNKENLNSSRTSLENTRQSILLQMISAYVNVQRFDKLLKLAGLSINNIQKQTELEHTRIERGRGYNTDLLQAKSQLAEAQARVVRAQRGLTQSINIYRNLFDEPPQITNAPSIAVSVPAIPSDLDTAVERALANSLLVKNARHSVGAAEQQLSVASGLRFGSLDAVAGVRARANIEGSESEILDYSLKLEYNLNTKLPSFGGHASDAASFLLEASRKLEASAKRDVILAVRQAWVDFESSQKVANIEEDRSLIAEEFLHLARRERELNRRSLLEVLSGETNLYAARIQSISANADMVIASYTLLQSMGLLQAAVIISSQNNTEPAS